MGLNEHRGSPPYSSTERLHPPKGRSEGEQPYVKAPRDTERGWEISHYGQSDDDDDKRKVRALAV